MTERRHPDAHCEECPLLQYGKGPVLGTGPKTADLVVVGESPGFEELRLGIPFVGESGKLLDQTLQAIDFDGTVYKTNACLCRPLRGRVTDEAIEACRPRLMHEVESILLENPTAKIVVMGNAAISALGKTTKTVTEVRGSRLRSVLGTGRLIEMVATYNPAAVLYEPSLYLTMANDLKKVLSQKSSWNTYSRTEVRVKMMHNMNDVRIHLKVPRSGRVVFDLETTQVHYLEHTILCLGLAFSDSPETVYVVPHWILYSQKDNPFWRKFWTQPEVSYCGHNSKFDMRFLHHHLGWTFVISTDDTLLMHYVLDERKGIHGLKQLLSEVLDYPDYEHELLSPHLKGKNALYSNIPSHVLYEYLALDIVGTMSLSFMLEEQLKSEGLYDTPYRDLVMACNDPLLRMELAGVCIDSSGLENAKTQFRTELEELRGELNHHVGLIMQSVKESDTVQLGKRTLNLKAYLQTVCQTPLGFNPLSNYQCKAVVYDALKMVQPKNASYKLSAESTAKGILLELVESNPHPFINLLLKYRRVSKMVNSYIGYLEAESRFDGRVHADFNIHGTETGRLSARLHTIPRANDKEDGRYGKIIRNLIVAPEGYLLMSVDYSQLELRILAHMSKDPFLTQAFMEGRDPHGEVASQLWGPQYSKEERDYAKDINFGFAYGGSKTGLASALAGRGRAKFPMSRALEVVDQYEKVMIRLKEWSREQLKLLYQQGYVATLTGRRRRLYFINDINKDEARKLSINAPVQGTGGDFTLIAAIELDKSPALKELGARLVLTVHDSLLLEVPDNPETVTSVRALVEGAMIESATRYASDMKWQVETKVGRQWGDLKHS